MHGPKRIVCLTEETTETLYLLGEQHRIVGISAFTVRPPEARKTKPVVSQYVHAEIDDIVALEPDLVMGFSDLQADICSELIRRGIAVLCFNQRSIEEILEMIHMVAGLVGCGEKGHRLVERLRGNVDTAVAMGKRLPARPRVFFEEWPDPIITGITWVSEIIEFVGGIDCFADLRDGRMAKQRIVTPAQVLERKPDLYLASWCGREFRRDTALDRPGFSAATFTWHHRVVELPSSIILQPGPACLTDGIEAVRAVVVRVANEMACTNP